MTITKMDDYLNSDGTTDWKSYERAQRNNGERCFDCGGFILRGSGHPEICAGCHSLKNITDSVIHPILIRCPICSDTWKPEDIYGEGGHTVYCGNCDAEFTVITHISFSFESPAIERNEHD